MRDDAVLRRALPLGRGLGRVLVGVSTKFSAEIFGAANQKCQSTKGKCLKIIHINVDSNR